MDEVYRAVKAKRRVGESERSDGYVRFLDGGGVVVVVVGRMMSAIDR
jgi:hypothetical protein